MPKYRFEETHKFLSFSSDALHGADAELWMMLGECQSKCEHLSKYPVRPDVADKIHRMYMAKGVLATTAIEGNTLSEAEVRKLLDGKLELPPSREYLAQEVQNIINECNRILGLAKSGSKLSLTAKRIKEINSTVLDNLELEDHVQKGKTRNYEVGLGLYKAPRADECDILLDKLCQWLNNPAYFGTENNPRSAVYGIIKATLAHLYLAWIHPFGDGNGRTARLIEFQILIESGVPSPAAHLLSNHYYRTRAEYYKQLHRASVSGGKVLPFITYAVHGFLDGLREQIEEVKKQMLDVVWDKYVGEEFEDRTSPANQRRRILIEELSKLIEPNAVSLDQLSIISPRVSKLYSKLSTRTLVRDLTELNKMRLIRFDKGLIRARKEVINAFLPVQARVPFAESNSE